MHNRGTQVEFNMTKYEVIKNEIKEQIEDGLPVLATCAGMILLAKDIEDDDTKHLSTLPITVKRNAYGRQLGSFYAEDSFANEGKIPMTFIRAPYISRVGDGVEVLAQVDGKTVAARQGKQLVTAFHPELNNDLTVHNYFIKMINGEI